jgi:peptidoglycan-N-acetylglucosamine deacetylase
MKVSLTFDNGPDAEVTPRVLEVLAKRRVPATFFVLGKNLAIPENRELSVRARREGHRIGNHSYTHSIPLGEVVRATDAVEEITSTDFLIGDLAGDERLFRPFGRGKVGPHLLNRLAWDELVARRSTCVLWNCIAPEAELPNSWMLPTVQECERRPWTVVVLHDIPTGATQHLDVFLNMLIDRRTEFSQEFPSDCVPLRRGVPMADYQRMVAN